MTKEEAKIVILEAALRQSHYTISFLHGCLTDKSYSYEYPDQTLNRLKEIEKLVDPEIGMCCHSGPTLGCDKCKEREKLNELEIEAEQILNQKDKFIEEIATYNRWKEMWIDNGLAGRWVVICKDEYDMPLEQNNNFETALTIGYEKYGLGNFMCRQILEVEPVYFV